ncbi:YbaB/EbfC family nucleoid-associated protein [Actinoallomurus sp. NPDC052308]|uniref:YbaB/EbfC family nucleoid-associated protein n=1 Tax=Actinoallomurus sp. NPDC052308 TaxID=3155530 RepID=UPI00343D16DE
MTSPSNENVPLSAGAQARLAEVEEAERRTQVTVDAVEQYAQQLRSLKDSFGRLGIKQSINPNLGYVVMNGNGDLMKIQLDPATLKAADPTLVGQRILDAIRAAQSRISRVREQKFAEVAESNHLYG